MFLLIKFIAYCLLFVLVDILLGANYKLHTMFAIEYSYYAQASEYTQALVHWYFNHIIQNENLSKLIYLTQVLGIAIFRFIGSFLLMPYFYITTIISLSFALHYVKQILIAKHYNFTGLIQLITLFILTLKLAAPLVLLQKLGHYQIINNLYLTLLCIAISLFITLNTNNQSL